MRSLLTALIVIVLASAVEAQEQSGTRSDFLVADHKAFVIEPLESQRTEGPMPWIWYAPTFANRLPAREEQWMFRQFHAAGIAVAGVDVGESYGSPKGRAIYQKLYEELTINRGYGKKPILLARSRGGLMLYNWAVEHAESVGGIAGIYPVCNIASYPGVPRAAGAYGMTAEQLREKLAEHNPIDRLAPLAKAKVPIMHIQGDSDRVVPHEKNTAIVAERYKALGGSMKFELIEGQGHNMWKGWFQSQPLTDFIIAHALGRSEEAKTSAVRKRFEMPGVTVYLQEKYVDLDATVCLDEGYLELIACTQDTKEHESIVTVSARPMHIHTALLLIGAVNGNPALTHQVGEEEKRWVHIPPRGDLIQISLIYESQGKKIERLIRDFVTRAPRDLPAEGKPAAFPTTFLFAGSRLIDREAGTRRYLADESGHVVSISSFGDEVLCLPGKHSQHNNSLVWQANTERLPEKGTKVTLRLRPATDIEQQKRTEEDK